MAWPAFGFELAIKWGPPSFNSDSTDCMQDGGPITNYRGTRIWLVNFNGPDTLYVGEFPAEVDSILVVVPDGMHGEVMAKAVKVGGYESCTAAHWLFTTPAVEPPPPQSGVGLRGEYYTYDRWNDFKVKLGERVDSTVNFDWGAGAAWPTGSPDYWSIRWTGTVEIPTAGVYTFYVEKNDGHRLYLGEDSTLVQNEWRDMTGEITNSMYLSAGPLPIRLEYYEGYSSAKCKLSWSGPGLPKQIIPRGALNP